MSIFRGPQSGRQHAAILCPVARISAGHPSTVEKWRLVMNNENMQYFQKFSRTCDFAEITTAYTSVLSGDLFISLSTEPFNGFAGFLLRGPRVVFGHDCFRMTENALRCF
jgi:hypothetical protein